MTKDAIIVRNARHSQWLYVVLRPRANALRGSLVVEVRSFGGRTRVALDMTVPEAVELSRLLYAAAVEAERLQQTHPANAR